LGFVTKVRIRALCSPPPSCGEQRELGDLLDTGHKSVEICHSILALFLITGAAKTNIVVRIARGIVQIQRECTRVAGIIPIATT